MLDRFRSTLKRDKRKSGVPAEAQVNGTSSSSANGAAKAEPKVVGAAGPKSDEEAQGRYPEPPHHSTAREDIEAAMKSFTGLISHSMRPLPDATGDGTYVEHDVHPSLFKELSTIGYKDVKTLKDQIEAGTGPIDDSTMLMERVIQLVADLPDNSIHRKQLTNSFVDQLFNSLQHPPLSYLGEDFKYRKADGSYNNIMAPHLGAANQPYARTVQPESMQPAARPDPGLVFDSLFERKEFRPHPNRNSSVIFYWASIIIHDLFQTDHHDFSKSQTSSYLDLSPLYGDVQEDQDQIRTFKDGKLKPDCFCEHRLLTFPPGCGVMLIMFNRFHNYVAEQLAIVNENNRFAKPKPDAPEAAWKKYDNDLFQTARLITGGLYMNITLIDYVRTIINLTRSNSSWTLDPRVKEGDSLYDATGTPRGIGNQVSAEFALVYRWHSAISEKDEQWTEELFKKMWGKPASDVTMPELLAGLAKWEHEMPADPMERSFADLKRGEDGKFSDDDLCEIITSSIEDCAGAFGANHIPKCMKAIEILGMRQARAWDVASLNEFRKFFGLKPHATFEEMNPDPKVAEQLRNLYETPDHVELYTGLIAERDKKPIPEDEGGPVGVGICPTYTISRAILSDAVALVRGDRFYTTDYNPRNLTNWGYSEVAYDFNVEQGCCFYKLFLRALPNHFEPNSIYAHMPMTIPSENRKIMRSLGRESHYNFERPKRQAGRIMVQNYHAAKKILEDGQKYKVLWGPAFSYVFGELGGKFMLAGDGPKYAKQKELMKESLYRDQWHQHIKDFYEQITLRLLQEKSKHIANINQVDLVRDVGNLAHVHFAAQIFALPLKDKEHPGGIFSEHELYLVLAAMFVLIFFDVDPTKSFPLALTARAVTQQLGKIVQGNVAWLNGTSWVKGLMDRFRQNSGPLSDYGIHMIRRLLESGLSPEEVTWSQIVPTAGAMVGNQATAFTQIMDFYFNTPEGQPHWADIVKLANAGGQEADEKILRYCMEGIRIHTGTFATYRQVEESDTIEDTGFQGKINVEKGDKVFISFLQANKDPGVFPEPMTVKLDRPMENYIHYGYGAHQCLGKDASRVALTAMVKTIAKSCKNLRPAPGPQGVLKKVEKGGGFVAYMTEDWGKFFPFPTTWKMHYDGALPESV